MNLSSSSWRRGAFAALLPVTALLAQGAGPSVAAPAVPGAPVTEARVRDVVGWLADDARAGRDTPSPGLDEAADWLAAKFKAAHLQPGVAGAWFHEYSLPGLQVDSTAISLKLVRKVGDDKVDVSLVADADVRLWRQGDVVSGADETCTVADADDPVLQRLVFAQSGRQPIVIEVAEDHPYWGAAKGSRRALLGRRAASRPVFLVRKGLLPAPPTDGRDVAWAATWSTADAEKIDLTLRNVVGLLPGTDKKDEYLVVSAHYDHVGTGNPVAGDGIYNGADDDASGTTAVVLLAEDLAKLPAPRRSVLFVCFSGEEKGLLGSKAFGERPPVPREQIVANLNIEMIGRPLEGNEGKAWITGSGYSDFAAIVGAGLERAGVSLVGFEMADRLFAQSDNYSLARHGIVAHSISAGSLHQDYHRPSDEVERLDIPHMAKIITGLREATLELANRDAAPQWSEAGKQVLERRRR